jgi:hypothetical protein
LGSEFDYPYEEKSKVIRERKGRNLKLKEIDFKEALFISKKLIKSFGYKELLSEPWKDRLTYGLLIADINESSRVLLRIMETIFESKPCS